MTTSHLGGRKRALKKIQFTMMVCGASGAGRTTFVNSLCENKVLQTAEESFEPAKAHIERGIDMRNRSTELEEPDGTRISLNIIDPLGFGDAIDNSLCFDSIVGYLESRFDEVLAEESRIRRNPRFTDSRVHVCLYFIDYTGHGLRELDLEMMRKLALRVNVIPVIGRADSLTPVEKSAAKRVIMEDIEHHRIPIFTFPYDPEEDDPETVRENSELRELLPFAVVSGTDTKTLGSTVHFGRAYPWGFVDSDDPRQSDFPILKAALFGTHLADLKDITHDYLYEKYRTEKLSGSAENIRESRSLNAEDLANQSYALKEEQIARDGLKLKDNEERVQREIEQRRLELVARENELRELEARISHERSRSSAITEASSLPSLSLTVVESAVSEAPTYDTQSSPSLRPFQTAESVASETITESTHDHAGE